MPLYCYPETLFISVLFTWKFFYLENVTEAETSSFEKNDTNKATTENTDDTAQDETKKTEDGTKHGSKKKYWNKELLLVSYFYLSYFEF